MPRISNYLRLHFLWLFHLSLVDIYRSHADLCQNGKTEVPSSCMTLENCNELRYLQNYYGADTTRFYLNEQLACEWNKNKEPTKFCCPNDTVARQMTPPPGWPNGPLSPPLCGTQVPVVEIDTVKTVTSKWTWLVDIVYESYRTGEITFVCSGSLITGLHVLTAARCIFDMHHSINMVRLRGFDNNSVSQIHPYPMNYYTRDAAIHPMYDYQNVLYDIAVVRLRNRIPWDVVRSGFVRPICLPILDFNDHENLIHGKLRLYDDDLDANEAPVEYLSSDRLINHTERQLLLIKSRSGDEYRDPAQIYGAPVVNSITAHTNGTYYILGIHTRYPRNYDNATDLVGIYTGVRYHLDYIKLQLYSL